MQLVTIISMCYFMHYRAFCLSMAWLGAICNALPHVTVRFIKIYIFNMSFFKEMTITPGNALQIAQNQENLRENINNECGNAFKLW